MKKNRDSAFIKDLTFNIMNPISQSKRDGVFRLSNTSIDKYKSNLYTLIFTTIGERVMEPTFGTNLRSYLFDQLTNDSMNKIREDIISKVAYWIPEILIHDISFGDYDTDVENNKISLKIDFGLRSDETIQDFIEIEVGI